MKTEVIDGVEWIIPDLKEILGPKKYAELHPDISNLVKNGPYMTVEDVEKFRRQLKSI